MIFMISAGEGGRGGLSLLSTVPRTALGGGGGGDFVYGSTKSKTLNVDYFMDSVFCERQTANFQTVHRLVPEELLLVKAPDS